MMQFSRHLFFALFLAPSVIALLVGVLSHAGVVSFQPSPGELIEVSLDMAARSFLAIALLRDIRWSYMATVTYLILFILYAVTYAFLFNVSSIDAVSLGILLLISGTALRCLQRTGAVQCPLRSIVTLGSIVQAVGTFLIVAAFWGVIVGACVVMVVFGSTHLLKRMS